ncbi:AfsR/SARP family transcriptional regulator [Streptomyces sp. ADMS]|uniref:AfsR/SARP family transcriptional regulator n=1 Tax=Streptomyces sp. ADMS TaxID=3071415 RepID=UPI00296ED9AD|nr:AfsR/SARP family transcriptional regulator [Streptomyces sp. ADMS]MDW4905889.1 AfsR/SARP family transcriptional regulator [Streptomyces sp. ADMS]
MQISLLGPLSVTVNGKNVTPTAPKPRRILALLATSANQVVRNEQLIEEVWEDRPPNSVATTLQTYIYQLRKSLRLAARSGVCDQDPGDELRTFVGGYMLTLPAEDLDSLRFEQRAQRGRAQLTAGETDKASRTLREALELWRGPAMVDMNPGPVLVSEALRLEEIRKSVLELRIGADLRLGYHHELLAELIKLVASQPTHEGFQAKLMIALYRAGRRSEALQVYQQARECLVRELGVDPSGVLQRLHHAILTGDLEQGTAPLDAIRF